MDSSLYSATTAYLINNIFFEMECGLSWYKNQCVSSTAILHILQKSALFQRDCEE